MAIEEHGAGRQLLRLRLWPKCSVKALLLPLLLAAISTGAAFQHTWAASVILSMGAMLLTLRTLQECAASTASVLRALHTIVRGNEEVDITWLGANILEPQFIHPLAHSNNGQRDNELHPEDTAEYGNGLIKGMLQLRPEKGLESKSAKV